MSLLAAIGSYPNVVSAQSLLGSQWVLAPTGTITHILETAAKNDTLYIASDEPSFGGSTTYLSSNGETWTTTAGRTGGLRGIFWDPVLQKFFAGEGSSGRISTTVDGVTWVVTVVGTVRWNGFARNNNLLVAVGQSGVIRTSTDGIAWTARSSGGSNALISVTWDETRSRFFIAGSFVFLHSDDGINWYSGGTANGTRRSIATNPNIMVQVGDGGVIYTSETGTTSGSWVLRTSGTAQNLNSVVWTGEQFVACGNGGTILNSEDGITWSPVSSGTTNDLYSIVKSPTRLIVVGTNTLLYTP